MAVAADRCPHRGGRLSDGRAVDGALECPYHGWRWDAEGSCALVPSQPGAHPAARLEAVASRERFGLVWASLQDPLTEPPSIPETEDAAGEWEFGHGDWFEVACGLRTITENFRDSSHFAFVHRETFGDVNPEVPAYTVRADGRRLSDPADPLRLGMVGRRRPGALVEVPLRGDRGHGGRGRAGAAALPVRRPVARLRLHRARGRRPASGLPGGGAPGTESRRCRVFFLVAADAEFRRRQGDSRPRSRSRRRCSPRTCRSLRGSTRRRRR